MISRLTELLRSPQEIKRKEIILQTLYKLGIGIRDPNSRRALITNPFLPQTLLSILSREDYLFTEAQKLIMDILTLTGVQLNEFQARLAENGLQHFQSRLCVPEATLGYPQNIIIINYACNTSTSNRIWNAVGGLLLSKLGNNSKYEHLLRQALTSLAENDRNVAADMIQVSSQMISCHLHGQKYELSDRIPEEERKVSITSPTSLLCLLSSLGEKYPDLASRAKETVSDVDLFYLPNQSHPLWKTEEIIPPPGINDVMALAHIFAGFFTADMLRKFTYDQVFFYSSFLLKASKQRKDWMLVLQDILNGTPSLAQHIYFIHKVTGFAPNSPITVWRSAKTMELTTKWLNEVLVIGSGKTKLQAGKEWQGLHLIDPLGTIMEPVSSIKLEKIYNSNARPMLIRLNPGNTTDKTSLLIFKRGDDLRQDFAVQTMFFIFNRLWALSPMQDMPFIHQYKIVPMGSKMGVLEFVSGCVPSGQYNWKKLNSSTPESLSASDKYTFILSMAGSYIGCWVLGIRDRHQDNMMIKDDKIFFHIDFGFILNEQPGFDAPIFSIPREVKRSLSTNEWNFFLKVCGDAFAVLHQNFDIILKACLEIMNAFTDITGEQIRKYLTASLMVSLSEAAAKQKVRQLVQEGALSTQKEMKYFMHDIAQKIK
eukprot:TRINITY_DN3157_c0_g1_i3.p1 TRINITY_DN3157_c0_g1~~TRINITY_DN3157_c0_g1_i3.p1  ORF type:complete len:654 (+),score=84.54 TRINITY_DN3157_c0_g1_i3:466-2427(+)